MSKTDLVELMEFVNLMATYLKIHSNNEIFDRWNLRTSENTGIMNFIYSLCIIYIFLHQNQQTLVFEIKV